MAENKKSCKECARANVDCKPHGGNHTKCFTEKANYIRAYKGFDKDMKCRGYQFEEGKEYAEETADLCNTGFHACEAPLNCFSYYAPNNSRYAKAELDATKQQDSDTKRVGKRIKIVKEISVSELAQAHVEWVKEQVDWKNAHNIDTDNYSIAANTGDNSAATNTGNYSAATNTGDMSAATNTGDMSAATNTGDYSAATNTGNYSAATNTGSKSAAANTGDYSAATNTGHMSAATNTGDMSAATNTGDYSAATNTGNYSAATNTGHMSAATNTGKKSAATSIGDYSAAEVSGNNSVAISTGMNSRVKGAIGCAIVCVEREHENGEMIAIKSAIVDGQIIKADTWYTVEGGEWVEII